MDMGTINIRILVEKVEDFLYDQLGRERYMACILREIYNRLLENLDGWPLVSEARQEHGHFPGSGQGAAGKG